jgi:hypothetical protein
MALKLNGVPFIRLKQFLSKIKTIHGTTTAMPWFEEG